MSGRRVLFIGGTGVISSACARVAVDSGVELVVVNRGSTTTRPLPAGVTVLNADVGDPASVRDVLGGRTFDAVVDWIAFTPEHVRAGIDLFRGRTGQYVLISSASAYQTPPARLRRRSCGRPTPTTARWFRSTVAGPRWPGCAGVPRSWCTATARPSGR